MTAEQLHDAIGLLPADLLAETDRARQAPPPGKTVLWKPVLAMAACLTLVLAGWFWWFQPKGSAGGTADTASLQAAPGAGAAENGAAEEAEMAQAAEEAAPFRSQSAATDGTSLPETISTPRLEGKPGDPAAALLTCPADWTDYRTQMGEQFDLTELAGRMESLGDSWLEDQDLVLIRVENYFEGQLQFENGLPRSTKGDAAYHGFGIKSIRYSVRKYGGQMDISTRDNWFELKLLIPVPEPSPAG